MKKRNKYPKVKVAHMRNEDIFGEVLSKGGATDVQLEIRKGVYYIGVAFCWSGDVYNKRKGKSIAFGRLMYALDILDTPNYAQTFNWILSKIGKIDTPLFLDAFDGEKIE